MATKAVERDDPNSTWNKAGEHEPLFILRAQDITAAGLVIQWANRAAKHGVNAEKVEEAREIAAAMEAWPGRRMPD